MDNFKSKQSNKTYTSLLTMSFDRVLGRHELLSSLEDNVEKLSTTYPDAKFKMNECINSGSDWVQSMIMIDGNFIKGIGLQDGWQLNKVYDSNGEKVPFKKWNEYIDMSALDEYGDGAEEAFFRDFMQGHEDLISDN